jgi:hypothetical protein
MQGGTPVLRALIPVTLLVAFISSIALAPLSTVRAQDASPTAGDTGAVADRLIQAMNEVFATGNASLLDEIVAAGYVNHTPSPTREGGLASPDLAGLKSGFEAVHAVFPDAKVSVDDSIVEGDRAALLVTFNGMGGPETETQGVIIIRVTDGRIAESWNFESGGSARMQPMFEATPAP